MAIAIKKYETSSPAVEPTVEMVGDQGVMLVKDVSGTADADYPLALAYDGGDRLVKLTKVLDSKNYEKTLTYDSDNLINISKWVLV